MSMDRYFDSAATTRVDPRVVEAMLPWFSEDFGNASSAHGFGNKAMAAVEMARMHVSALFDPQPEMIVFTSGATEANNWCLKFDAGLAQSPFEHASVWVPARDNGASVLPNDDYDLEFVPCRQMAVMRVVNETGAFLDAPEHHNIHVDATQMAGKFLDVGPYNSLSASAHKFYGPKGVGIAAWCQECNPDVYIHGGGQEYGLRGGTINVPGIVGMGKAAELALEEMDQRLEHVTHLRSIVMDELCGLSDWQTNDGKRQSPYILSLSFAHVEGETILMEADAAGFALSAGSACSSAKTVPSHVLRNLNIPDDRIRGTIRVSFGTWNTDESTHELAQLLRRTIERLRNMRKN